MVRRLVVALVAVLALLSPATALAQSAPACQYILGFATLHSLDPGDVGDCLDNQAFAANGDAQQHTTKGLLAWRKADNWTAFTNGYWTWINGPNGLAKRLNTQRYSWEANPDGLAVIDNAGIVIKAPSPAVPASPSIAVLPAPPAPGSAGAPGPMAPPPVALPPIAPPPPVASAPVGAPAVTAICNDGTSSYSAHASGTCSHHGGVQTWVNHPSS